MEIKKLKDEKTTTFIKPIIDTKHLVNPIKIDEDFIKNKKKIQKNDEQKLINPIVIDRDYLKSKAKNKKIEMVNPIVVDKKFKETKSEKTIKQESLSSPVEMKGISKAAYQYILNHNLTYDIFKLLTPQLDNSIGGAKSLLSVLPEVIYNEKEKKVHLWDGKIWSHISESAFRKKCVELMEVQYDLASLCNKLEKSMVDNGKNHAFEGIIAMIKNMVTLDPSKFNSAERILCLKNGIFSFDDLKLHAFEEYKYSYITNMIDCEYDPNARSAVVDNFLFSIMGDGENMQFLQQILGYAIIGNPTQQKAFILEGNGSNGKSTLLGALHNLLGEFMASLTIAYFTGDSNDDPNRPSPATYSIKNKLIVYASEAQTSSYLNESKVKKFIGGGKLTGRPPYGQLVEFDNKATLFFDTNHLPHFKSGGFSMERRLYVVPFPYSFTKDAVDVHLSDKLKTPEAKRALLSWLINGAIQYLRAGKFIVPQRVDDATRAFFKEEDSIGNFMDECTERDPHSAVTFQALYTAYKDYCIRNCLEPKNVDTFSKSERLKEFPVVRGKTRRRKGLRVIDNNE